MLKDFRAFIMRGNVVDLAVAVVLGVAFGAVVTSLVDNIITPLLTLLRLPDFSNATVGVGDATLEYGLFLNALIAFLTIAAVIFFLVVRPLNRFMEKPPDTKDCPHCLTAIPAAAAVCSSCTRDVAARKTTRRR